MPVNGYTSHPLALPPIARLVAALNRDNCAAPYFRSNPEEFQGRAFNG